MRLDRELLDAVKRDVAEYWSWLRRTYPRETIYGLALYTSELAQSFTPVAVGEQGLRQAVAQALKSRVFKKPAEAEAGLRWALDESPYAKFDHFGLAARRVLDARPVDDVSPTDVEIRARTAAAGEALRQLDREGLFGTGDARRRIVLWMEVGGCPEEEFMNFWAKHLNPPEVYEAWLHRYPEPPPTAWTEYGETFASETSSVVASADGGLVAIGGGTDVWLFDLRRPGEFRELWCRGVPSRGNRQFVHRVSMTSDGTTVAAVAGYLPAKNGHLAVWRGRDWSDKLAAKLPALPLNLAVHPRGDWFAVACNDRHIHVFDRDAKPLRVLTGHDEVPRGLAVNGDGTLLASADLRNGIRLWDTADGSPAGTIDYPASRVAFDPTGWRVLAFALRPHETDLAARPTPAAELRLFDVATGAAAKTFRVSDFRFTAAGFSPDGTQLACGLRSLTDADVNQVAVLEVASGAVVRRLEDENLEWLADFAFLPRHRAVALAGDGQFEKALVLWPQD